MKLVPCAVQLGSARGPLLDLYQNSTGLLRHRLGLDWTSPTLLLDLCDLDWTSTGPLLVLDICWTSTGPLLDHDWTSIGPRLDWASYWDSTELLLDLYMYWASAGPLLDRYLIRRQPSDLQDPRTLDLHSASTGPPTKPLLGGGPPEDGSPDVPRRNCLWSGHALSVHLLDLYWNPTGALPDFYRASTCLLLDFYWAPTNSSLDQY